MVNRFSIFPFSICVIALLFYSLIAFSQNKNANRFDPIENNLHLVKLVLEDRSNFELMNLMEEKMPKIILVSDTTAAWSKGTFWLDGIDLKNAAIQKDQEADEHSVYNSQYLFKDSSVDKLINNQEKILLEQKAGNLPRVGMSLSGSNYRSIHSSKDAKHFYVIFTQPVYSSDEEFAFISFLIYINEKDTGEEGDECFGYATLIYSHQYGNWRRIYKRERLML